MIGLRQGLAIAVLVPGFTAAAAAPPAPVRGELLYENHCHGCHQSVVHVREDHRAQSPEQVREQVQRWATQQELGWGPAEVLDVSDFLVRRYYRFDAP